MGTTETNSTDVSWRQLSPSEVTAPLVRRVPYVELKLEHPTLEPTTYNEQFYPDAIPYEKDGDSRVFYWRPALESVTPLPADWQLACATTHGLAGMATLPAPSPALTTDGAAGEIVVEGTVAGDATMATVGSYSVPAVRIEGISESAVELSVNGRRDTASRGERCRIELPQHRVDVLDENESVTVTPELAVRYPGRREIHHPAPGATYRLFPSFGLDLDELPVPLSVPTTAGELDDEHLAEQLGIDRSARPYAERVLWQAFAYSAFDPHDDATPELAQLPQDHLVLRSEEGTVA